MDKFCSNCGAPVKEGSKFCSQCGAPLTAPAAEAKNAAPAAGQKPEKQGETPFPTGNAPKSRKNAIIAGIVAAIVICGAGAYYMTSTGEPEKKAQAAAVIEEEKPREATKETAQPVQQDPLQVVQQEMERRGVSGKVMASSYGHNPDGCLVLLGGKGIRLAIWDIKNNRVAFTSSPSVFNFTGSGPANSSPSPLIFDLQVENDARDKDESAGYWSGSTHTIPIYALYKFGNTGNVVPGMLCTGSGARPSHYHSYLQEQKNVDTINLVLTEMAALRQDMAARSVKI